MQESIGETTIIIVGPNLTNVFQFAADLSRTVSVFTNIVPGHGCRVMVQSDDPEQEATWHLATSFTATVSGDVSYVGQSLRNAINIFSKGKTHRMTHDVPPEFENHIPKIKGGNYNEFSTWVFRLAS